MTEAEHRALFVQTAMTWIGTRYHHRARVKGVGCDCLTLIVEAAEEAGVLFGVDVPFYRQDFNLHRSREIYLEGLQQYGHEIDTPPQPGDIVIWKFGRCYSHAAIVVDWPIVLHAASGKLVSLEDAEAAAWLTHIGEGRRDNGKPRPKKFFSIW